MKKLLILYYTINLSAVDVQIFYGATGTPYIETIARIGAVVFRDYPYFEDDMYQQQYYFFHYYTQVKSGVTCIAYHKSEIIGAVLGCCLKDLWDTYKEPFLKNTAKLEDYFYVGELVVKKEYQLKGVGSQLYHRLEQIVKTQYKNICLAIVEEPISSEKEKLLSYFWHKKGFERTHLFFKDSWKQIGKKEISEHRMIFYVKRLI